MRNPKAVCDRILRIMCTVLVWWTAISLTGCEIPADKVILSLGEYEDHVFYSSGGFQDYTDYAKYYYAQTKIAENHYLKPIRKTDFTTIDIHLDDFEGWIATIARTEPDNKVVLNYDFDRSIIGTEDYIYIDSESHTWPSGHTALVRYNIYFFDTQTQILYYFHNNI